MQADNSGKAHDPSWVSQSLVQTGALVLGEGATGPLVWRDHHQRSHLTEEQCQDGYH